jgi:hypothetical protein
MTSITVARHVTRTRGDSGAGGSVVTANAAGHATVSESAHRHCSVADTLPSAAMLSSTVRSRGIATGFGVDVEAVATPPDCVSITPLGLRRASLGVRVGVGER